MSPFEALLCERSPQHKADWEAGFRCASIYVENYPLAAKAMHRVVGQGLAGSETANILHMDYNAFNEGLWHGVFGEVEYLIWASR